ncbi:MAG: InlB B-repeat-containing protein [Bacteroidales bacterium]|nr:InlB B-repeat-containing protein [Bacteroidales bacterium]
MKKILTLTLTAILCCLLTGVAQAQSTKDTTVKITSGSGTWTAPVGARTITMVEVYGGGGGGGNAITARTVGAGGGSGAYATKNIEMQVVPGQSYLYYDVATGGNGGSRGGTSYVKETQSASGYLARATGGYAGNNVQIANSGATATSQTSQQTAVAEATDGDIKTNGNAPNRGSITRTRSGSFFYSYSYSGTSGVGAKNVNNENGGSSVTSASKGNNATNVGAGGSGALNTTTSTQNSYTGGTGARGQVNITYQILTLTVTLDQNYLGAPDAETFDVLYYGTYGNNLTTPSRGERYIFLGWFTEPTGGTQVTATDQCTSTINVTLYAHWAYAGAITTITETIDPCGNYGVTEDTAAYGDIVYSWKYSFNNGNWQDIANVTTATLTQADMNLNQMGTYEFQRFISGNSQTAISGGTFSVKVKGLTTAGAITSGSKYSCTTGSDTIKNVTEATPEYSTSTVTYIWKYSKDGGAETTIDNSNSASYIAQNLTAGTYVFKRYATIGCAEPVVSAGEDTLIVIDLNNYTPTVSANYTQLCEGGTLEIVSDNYELSDIDQNYNYPTFKWMISEDGVNFNQVPDMYGKTLSLVINNDGSYNFYLNLTYFGLPACVISTDTTDITVVDDPTIGAPNMSATEPICPNSETTMEAANIQGGLGSYTYTWEFLPAGGDETTDWVDTAATQATYSSNATGSTLTADNFLVTGDVKYRTKISNAQGCDYTSDPATLSIIELPIPTVSQPMDVCPVPGDTAFTTMVNTTDPSYELRWFADATSTTSIDAPTTPLVNEGVLTYYVAQYNPNNGCLGARVPVELTITYTAHLGHTGGDTVQVVCQNSAMEAITFDHSGDCAPQVNWNPNKPAGVTVTTENGITTIAGTPEEAGNYTFQVELHPDAQTVCAAPNVFTGRIQVNTIYNVTVDTTICSGSVTISDNNGHSYTFSESGNYTRTLGAATGCDSVVTLNLYVHEWNQFGFKENEELIAGWTSFNSVSSPINADVAGSVSGSRITYSGWNGSNARRDNLASTSMVSASGYSLGLVNGSSSSNLNNGKTITITTSTKDFGNLKLHFDYGAERYQSVTGIYSSNDKAFTDITYRVATTTGSTDLSSTHIELQESTLTTGSVDIDLSASEDLRNLIENQDNITITLTFSGAAYSIVPLVTHTQYLRLDNICISGTKAIDEIELSRADETEPCCTNQPLTLVATAPYVNTNAEPAVETPIIYKWERIVGGVSTVLDETSYVLTDNDVQEGDYQYVVSVGEAPCGKSDTINVHGIKPAYRLDIVRHGTVCSNKVDQISNIDFTDCEYEDGMFIVTPSVNEMRTPGIYECQLSVPTTENPCDSVITLMLEVLKAFDTTIVANICLGETYNQYGFNITPTEEGTTYHISDPSWTCTTGCDSIYRLTLITSSVKQTLSSETNVTLAAWPMDHGINKFVPACGVRTANSSFMVYGGEYMPSFTNTTGHAPSSDYCYAAASSNGALNWANLSSDCSGLWKTPTYIDYSGAYFEIRINPYDYENLKLKFDYSRQNASSNGQAFNRVNYYYKFSETGSYTPLGYANINSTNWDSQTLDFSSANAIDRNVMYLKVEFTGGSAGNTQNCGTAQGSKYLPSYITVDNVKITGDRPARASLDGNAQTCIETYVCEGNEVVFNCQGDDNYFKFYVVDETANDTTAFNGSFSLVKTPTQSSTYKIVGVEQTTMCDTVWGPFNVEVVKNPTITASQGELNLGICGHDTVNNVLLIENATGYTFSWLTDSLGLAHTETTGHQVDTITITGTLTEGGYVGYRIIANPDDRCSSVNVREEGSITVRRVPTFEQTIGKDTVCEGADMQFVVDTTGCNFFQIAPDQRIKWYTNNVVLGNEDTLNYVAEEATHSARHYIMVNQNGCTTIDSMDIVVYKFDADTLRLKESHYVLNYGDNYLIADSVQKPDLMHNGEAIDEKNIQSITISGITGNKIPVNSITDLSATIIWDVVDMCGNTHSKEQVLTFELPPCGDEDHFFVTDVDGNEYHTVRMGWNCWMRENLKTLNYADNTPVAKAMGYVSSEFPNADTTAKTFGRLYSWYSSMGIEEGSNTMPTVNEFGHVQGVCPEGWFVPAPEQFNTMSEIDMVNLRAPEYWLDGGGNNSTNFSILPGGAYNSDKVRFENILGNAYFWSTDLTGSAQPRAYMADCNCYMWQILDSSPKHGFSVRCVKEKVKNE